jgi:hypothetical protein
MKSWRVLYRGKNWRENMTNAERQKRYRARKTVTQTVTAEGESVTVQARSVTPRQKTVTPPAVAVPQRINPHTGKPYGPLMASFGGAVLTEYERKWGQYKPCYQEHECRTFKPVLVIAELPQEQRDYLYQCLQRGYRSRESM